MSHLLWKFYWENDVDKFCRLLAPAGYSQNSSKGSGSGVGSPGAFGSSPRTSAKSRKASGLGVSVVAPKNAGSNLGKGEINSRDYSGLTVLLRAASSTSSNAVVFVEALLNHPAIDIYVQDYESGWNALHRALYNGNISIARLLLDKERNDLTSSLGGATATRVGQLIKTKDHEGNSPFDVYNASIALRTLKVSEERASLEDDESDSDEGSTAEDARHHGKSVALGEEVFTFGSNNNFSLGLGDEDDRQFPERISLKRPDHLIHYFYNQYLEERKLKSSMEDSMPHDLSQLPVLIQNRPLIIQDVVLSKLHSAVLTTDPISNLYVCGIGRGGRLGLGDESTRFSFMPVQGGLSDKKVIQISLGQNHSLAVTSTGELWTWGSNTYSQLGIPLPAPATPDEEPISTAPRQVFGPLKKEIILGAAASAIHSVAHTGSSLFCWGKNVGQLALMDADSRSLEVQAVPRKVAATLLSNHSSIVMVSAIEKATSCLFEDHTVCVFTSYGYNMIKFPTFDPFTSSPLQRSVQLSMSSRRDPGRREVYQITSGGDTIAAVTGNGDLFTMIVNHKYDGNRSAASTTNPSKIKDAVTTPQCIWSSKKDGVRSVSVGENGSVMISTQSGAVWRRIKRTKAKDTKVPGAADPNKRKDFKFQRVPYITDIVAVRSSAFGAYAAVRKDCDVTREQLEIDNPTLWQDIAPLFPLSGFRALNTRTRENKDTWKFQDPDVLKGRVDTLAYEVLTSTDLEDDLQAHLNNWHFNHDSLGMVIRAAAFPELAIPVHSWLLSARSPLLRAGLQQFRDIGIYEVSDLLKISEDNSVVIIEFTGSVDIITLMNLITYIYRDRVIPAWNFTRQSKPLAYRYRQIRTELMKLATGLGMADLEAAVRVQSSPSRSMNKDFKKAIEDTAFFEDGDALLELEGDEILVHSDLLCQRCPWFQGLFKGRSRGMWLQSRRAAQTDYDYIKIDLKHMDPEAFHYVLQHLYADIGEELFDEVVAENLDDFSELVMDVMGIANELMLDRLSQICQKVIGRFVNTRNISNLLNIISPCSVTEFKDKGLEYICLQMESMLENHLLDDLDEDLLLELDEVVRDNQLARCPFARSGRADLLLHERHPELAQDIDEERQRRVKEMAYKITHKEDERKLSTSFKSRVGSLDEPTSVTPIIDRSRRKSKVVRNEPFTPELRPRDSHADLIFAMDEEGSPGATAPVSPSPQPSQLREQNEIDQLSTLASPWKDSKGKLVGDHMTPKTGTPASASRPNPTPEVMQDGLTRRAPSGGNPWGPSSLPTSRLDLREVLSGSRPAHSALSAELAAEKREASSKATPQKMSQKERKRQLQQQAEQVARQESQSQQSQSPWTKAGAKKDSPWQNSHPASKISMTGISEYPAGSSAGPLRPKPLLAAEASSSKSIPRRTASPDTRFPGQKSNNGSQASMTTAQSNSQLTPHSKSYIKRAPKPEQEMGLGLADIIGEQRREQEIVREAVAKRSLQEIQQEQAFQEWWDQESRRMQEEEARRTAREEGKEKKKDNSNNRRSNRNNKSRGGNSNRANNNGGNNIGTAKATEPGPSSNSRGRGRGNRGKAV
ncbi:hypothetical protein F5Y11DRAFT_320229 [Daldinia sp. FL1419]|nr:hypothetical protein F5Y11DRAFT_320229 [Daldinia sp. FL1419]